MFNGRLMILVILLAVAAGFSPGAWAQGYVFGRADFSNGVAPYWLTTGDFDGDGKPDLVVTNPVGTVSVLLGNDDGTFADPVYYAVGGSPRVASTGDFNRDGWTDLVVGTYGTNVISVLINNRKANGGFWDHMDYVAGNSPQIVAVADFNGDNKLDLAASNLNSANVSVLLGNGDGTFQTAVQYPAGDTPGRLFAADFNKDGKVDLAVPNFYANTVSVLLGNGNGSFGTPVPYGTGANPCNVVAADFNNDDELDLAISDYGSTSVSILLGNGDGTFKPKADYGTDTNPDGLAAGDFDGDGRLDLAVGSWNSNDVSVMLGKGAGTFQPRVDYKAGVGCVGVATADFNGDGKLDLAVANYGNGSGSTITVLLGRGDGSFDTQTKYGTASGPGTAVTGDFKKDGKPDLAVNTVGPNGTGTTVSFLAGNGNGTFQPYVAYPAGLDPAGLTSGDFNKDGNLDLAATNYELGYGNTVSILLGDGAGAFQTPVTYGVDFGPVAVEAADFNKDGNLDLVVSNFGKPNQPTQHVSVLLGNGDGTFQNQVYYETWTAPVGLAIGDFNADGNLDIAVADFGDSAVSILLGNGNGTFQPQSVIGVGVNPGGVKAGDFNGDGKLDLVVANSGSNNVSILIGNGNGTFQPRVDYAAITGASWLSVGDFNGDSKLDIAVAPVMQGNTAGILFGNGNGTFKPCVTYGVGSSASWVVAEDLNGDQAPDMIVSNYGSDSVSVFLNTPAIAIYPTKLVLPTFSVGSSVDKNVQVYNSGGAPLKLFAISITGANAGDFTSSTNCGTEVAPGGNCQITVTFKRGATGNRAANLRIDDNSPGSPQILPMLSEGGFIGGSIGIGGSPHSRGSKTNRR